MDSAAVLAAISETFLILGILANSTTGEFKLKSGILANSTTGEFLYG